MPIEVSSGTPGVRGGGPDRVLAMNGTREVLVEGECSYHLANTPGSLGVSVKCTIIQLLK